MTARSLHIAPALRLPLDTVTSTLVVYGGKGMGKTNFGSVLVEEMTKAGLRWAVLDPLGVWWGLRHSEDGKAPGIECLILGGAHGDLPLEPTAGAVVADLVVQEDTNVVIDFSRKPSGKMWTVGERIRFVTDYAVRLFERQGELVGSRRREPIMQILDEAARYIPQTIPHGAVDLAKCVGAWEQITEEGRNVGLGVTFLTQRSARMNKSVSELAEAMVAFRIVGPRSIEAVMDWLGEHVEKERRKDLVDQLRRLPVGHALVVSPGWLGMEQVVPVRMRETFDSSATPKPGERRRQPGRAAKPDLEKYRTRMAETIEKAKAEDPRELRRRIADLEKQLRAKVPAPAAAVAVKEVAKRVEVPVLPDRQIIKLEGVARSFRTDALQLISAGGNLEKLVSEISKVIAAAPRTHGTPRTVTPPAPRPAVQVATRPPAPRSESSSGVSSLQQRILNALAWLESIGVEQGDRTQVALIARAKATGGHYINQVSALRTQGLLSYPRDGALALTDAGRAVAVLAMDVPQTSHQLQQQVFGMVTGLQRKILEHVVGAYPAAVDREDLAAAVGANAAGGHFINQVSALRTLGVLDYPTKGQVVATPVLFLEGR